MNDALLAIAVADIRPACAGEPDLIERLRKAMVKAQDFFMSTDDDLRFRGACGAAMLESDEAERERIVKSINVLRALGAAMSGVAVDFGAELDKMGDEEPLPLRKLWIEAKAADQR
jgi:hypothetical protein